MSYEEDKRLPSLGADRKEISQWLILGRSLMAGEIVVEGLGVGFLSSNKNK